MAPPLVTVDGTEALLYAERYYALTQWLPGDAADFGKAEQVERVGASLAQLHQTSCGYRPYFYQGRITWGQTLLIFRRKQKEMVAFAKQAKAATPPDLCDLQMCRRDRSCRSSLWLFFCEKIDEGLPFMRASGIIEIT